MPFADPDKRREYFRAYKAKAREKARSGRFPKPHVLREGQWAEGHSDLARCLTCGLPITTKPRECSQPKHLERYLQRRERNNQYRKEQRAAARTRGEIKRYGSPEAKKEQTKRAYRKRRMEIIARLGGCCDTCGHADHRALQVHHRNGGGRAERERKGWRYHLDMAAMSAEELRASHRLLCANCHQVEHYNEADQNAVEEVGRI